MKAIPDRWLDYQSLGQPILGTKIVAFKVPLKLNVCRTLLPENEWFTPTILLEKQPRLKTVIDLTNTYRYYNGEEEFGTKGIDHVKILVEGRGTIPAISQLQRFFDIMDSHMEKYADTTDALVGVHCTHGLNRTGYFVCRWMVDRLKINPEDAIERFNQARGHHIERKPLLDDIKIEHLPILPRTFEFSNTPTRRNQYTSPLNDSSYDEPRNHSRYSRDRDRGRGNCSWRDKDRSSHRHQEERSRFDKDKEGSSRRRDKNTDRSKKHGNRGRPSKADLDTNWRSHENVEKPVAREERFSHFKHKDKHRPRTSKGDKRESNRPVP